MDSFSGRRTSYAATRCVVFTQRRGTPFILRSQIPNSSNSEVVCAKQISKFHRVGSKIHGARGIGRCSPGYVFSGTLGSATVPGASSSGVASGSCGPITVTW